MIACDASQASAAASADRAAVSAREQFNNWTDDDASVVRGACRRALRRQGGICRERLWRGELYAWVGDGRCTAPSARRVE